MMCSDQIASDHEQYAAARASAIRFIGISLKSSGRVCAHLVSKGFEEDLAHHVVNVLIQDRYIDDHRVGRNIISKRRGRHAEGSLKLRQRMLAMGISPDVVSGLLLSLVDDDVLIREILEERFKFDFEEKNDELIARDEYRKVYQFLLGRGFRSDLVSRYLNNR